VRSPCRWSSGRSRWPRGGTVGIARRVG
jgi:hypothetical protein